MDGRKRKIFEGEGGWFPWRPGFLTNNTLGGGSGGGTRDFVDHDGRSERRRGREDGAYVGSGKVQGGIIGEFQLVVQVAGGGVVNEVDGN